MSIFQFVLTRGNRPRVSTPKYCSTSSCGTQICWPTSIVSGSKGAKPKCRRSWTYATLLIAVTWVDDRSYGTRSGS